MKRALLLGFVTLSLVAMASYFGFFGCSDGGKKGDEPGEKPPSPGLNDGPTNPYLLYSAFDGNDYEIYLLKPAAFPPPVVMESGATTPKALTKETPVADHEVIQLTDNDTHDLNAVCAGAVCAWACDDGAGSELCVKNENNEFKQETDVKGGGALGRTVNLPYVALSEDRGLASASLDTDGRFNRLGVGILNYNFGDGKLVQKGVADILGITDVSTIISPAISPLVAQVNGSSIYAVTENTRGNPTYFLKDATGDFKKIKGDSLTFSGNFIAGPDGFFAIAKNSSTSEFVFGGIGVDGSFSQIGSLGKVAGEDARRCSLPRSKSGRAAVYTGNIGLTYDVYPGTDTAKNMRLYVYQKADKALKMLVDEKRTSANSYTYMSASGECLQSVDGGKIVFRRMSSDADNKNTTVSYSMFDVASGKETQVYSLAVRDGSGTNLNVTTVDFLDDLSRVAFRVEDNSSRKTKLVLVDTSTGTPSEFEADTWGYLSGFVDSQYFAFESERNKGDSFVYSVSKGAATALPMPIYDASMLCGGYILLYKQVCPVGECSPYDKRATVAYKVYRVEKQDTIDLAVNGKDLVAPRCVYLTDGQYGRLKELAENADRRKEMKPLADSGGIAFDNDIPAEISFGGDYVNSPAWYGRARAYSRNKDAKFVMNLTFHEQTKSDFKMEDDSSIFGAGYQLGIWPSAAFVKSKSVLNALTSPKDGETATLSMSDGATQIEDKIKITVPPNRPPVISINGYPSLAQDGSLTCSTTDSYCGLYVYVTDESSSTNQGTLKVTLGGGAEGNFDAATSTCLPTNSFSSAISCYVYFKNDASADWEGTVSLVATDSEGAEDTKTIAVHMKKAGGGANRPPVIVCGSSRETDGGAFTAIGDCILECSVGNAGCRILISAIDPDNDSVVITATFGEDVSDHVLGNACSAAENDCIISFKTGTNEQTWTGSISLTASDGRGGVVTKAATVRMSAAVQDQPPTVTATSSSPVNRLAEDNTLICYKNEPDCSITLRATDDNGSVASRSMDPASSSLIAANGWTVPGTDLRSEAVVTFRTGETTTTPVIIKFNATDNGGNVGELELKLQVLLPGVLINAVEVADPTISAISPWTRVCSSEGGAECGVKVSGIPIAPATSVTSMSIMEVTDGTANLTWKKISTSEWLLDVKDPTIEGLFKARLTATSNLGGKSTMDFIIVVP